MTKGKEIVVKSWLELQSALFDHSWNEEIGRFRSSYVYRGAADKGYSLNTSISRIGKNYAQLETHILRNFKKYARTETSHANYSVWNWLAVAQHHGLPTRLLDWTYSPYVALHFVTQDLKQYHLDGAVWCIDYVKAKEELPKPLKDALFEEGNVFTPELLEPVCSSLTELAGFQDDPFVVFLEPPSIDARIVHQYALFSMMSKVNGDLSAWLQNHPDIYFRIIIPAELKWEIRDKLDQANITERVLMPGLSGLSQWLKRHYTHLYMKEDLNIAANEINEP
ncbi:FRG domain-containing protein [Pontibacter sp. SGAir0037]|uniref:FRG domain-containing protein n=1 Tax=Pontibacter sp. SGAir0037 TaxID=2571030 RepID=UPI0010CD4ED2|nr:FRG domain-containing protein [Pontibacter sp. SGAir0037]QCR21715.1 FRG domain-containing protein [Pontibacter sp. SGAir0037]